MRHAALTLAAVCLLVGGSVVTRAMEDSLVFACNYTIELSVDGNAGVITHQDRVRNESYIPLYVQDFQLRLGVSSTAAGAALVEIVILERDGDSWRAIYPRPLSFEVNLGAPSEFSYADEFLELEIALIVSVRPH